MDKDRPSIRTGFSFLLTISNFKDQEAELRIAYRYALVCVSKARKLDIMPVSLSTVLNVDMLERK